MWVQKSESELLARSVSCAVCAGIETDWQCAGDAVKTVVSSSLTAVIANNISKADNDQIDWEEAVLQPIFNTYATATATDTDQLVTYISAILLIAYEIIRQHDSVLSQADFDSKASMFHIFLGDEIVLLAVRRILDAETEKCPGLDDDFGKVNALFVLNGLMADTNIRIEKEENNTEPKVEFSDIMNGTLTTPGAALPPFTHSTGSRDVEIQYFLHPGCALKIDSVASIDVWKETLVLESSDSLRIQIEEGVTCSNVINAHKSVEIRAPTTDGFNLSATVILFLGQSYTISSAVRSGQEAENAQWTVVDTEEATVWIGNGQYSIERAGNLVKIQNVLELF